MKRLEVSKIVKIVLNLNCVKRSDVIQMIVCAAETLTSFCIHYLA